MAARSVSVEIMGRAACEKSTKNSKLLWKY